MPSKANKEITPILVSAEVVAKALNLSVSRVNQISREEIIPKSGGDGRWDLISCCAAYVGSLKESSEKNQGYWQEKTRLTKAQADKEESLLREREGRLLVAEEVERANALVAAGMKARLLSIPTRLAAELAITNNPNVCKQLLEDSLYEALEEMSHWERDKLRLLIWLKEEIETAIADYP